MGRMMIFCCFSFLLLWNCNRPYPEKNSKPNIVFLIADDMGYGDFEMIGGSTQTPNLNRLASEGVFFDNFYAAAPNCSPSRTGLLTGKSPAKVGMYSYRPPLHPFHLPDQEITLAELLKTEGYQTAHFGKWHLGDLSQDSILNHPQPHDQGFDYSLGTENNAEPSHHNPINFIRNGKPLGVVEGYSCQIVADESIDWLNQKSGDPFFMYVAFHEPHRKVASPETFIEPYKDLPLKDAEYLANIDHLDTAIGRILDYLEQNKLMDNTIIMFSSDNGSYRLASNGGLKAVKSYLYDGGIRVPGIVRWSGIQTDKKVIHTPTGLVDVVPTLCDLVGIEPPKNLDGTSFLPLLKGTDFKRKRPLYWFFYRSKPEMAMRVGDYMILGLDRDTLPRAHQFSQDDYEYLKTITLKSFELYDLSNDFSEKNNLFDDHPKKDSLKALINNQLVEIKNNLYPWKNLPLNHERRKQKTMWVKY
jgi:arylsulfatase A